MPVYVLFTYCLYRKGVLHKPLLYLTCFLKKHQYYDRLNLIREKGDMAVSIGGIEGKKYKRYNDVW
jgi:hypothetical protein